MKFLVEEMGADTFVAEWSARFDAAKRTTKYRPFPVDVLPPTDVADVLRHVPEGGWSTSVRPQRTPGLAMVTVNVPLGDLTGDEFQQALGALAPFGDGVVHVTQEPEPHV